MDVCSKRVFLGDIEVFLAANCSNQLRTWSLNWWLRHHEWSAHDDGALTSNSPQLAQVKRPCTGTIWCWIIWERERERCIICMIYNYIYVFIYDCYMVCVVPKRLCLPGGWDVIHMYIRHTSCHVYICIYAYIYIYVCKHPTRYRELLKSCLD